ncbi:MAG: MarR family winged helix-turn-helix transcriptional regulator [Clostridiaceae bacterium]
MSENKSKSIVIVKLLKQIICTGKHKIKGNFKDLKLTGAQGMIMGILQHNEDVKISDLSEKTALSNSTISGMIDRMEKLGYVVRERSKEDKRVVFVRVTSEFKGIVKTNFDKMETNFETKLGEADPGEIDKIINGLEALKNILEEL